MDSGCNSGRTLNLPLHSRVKSAVTVASELRPKRLKTQQSASKVMAFILWYSHGSLKDKKRPHIKKKKLLFIMSQVDEKFGKKYRNYALNSVRTHRIRQILLSATITCPQTWNKYLQGQYYHRLKRWSSYKKRIHMFEKPWNDFFALEGNSDVEYCWFAGCPTIVIYRS